jgi:hypothetical protein
MQRKSILHRVGRAGPQTTRRSPSLWEITRDLPPSPLERAERSRREAEAEAEAEVEAEKAAAAPEPAEAKAEPADAKPVVAPPQTPPPEPQWWEEKCRWRPRGAPAPYDDGLELYETIHRYDPLERALAEEDYDPDDYCSGKF